MAIARKRLLWKGTFFIAVSSAIFLILFTLFFSEYFSRRFIKKTQDYGSFLLEAVQQDFQQGMIHQDRKATLKLFEDLSRHEEIIKRLAIFDGAGNLAVNAGKGQNFPPDLSRSIPAAMQDLQVILPESDGARSMVMARHIFNEEGCWGCHPAQQARLGTIAIELSMKGFDEFVATTRIIMLCVVGAMVFLLMAVNLSFFSRFVVDPLSQLRFKIREVERGNHEVEFREGPGDEISELEGSFGTMVRKLEEHHQLHVEREKEMALMVQDLKHQMEISAVNQQLANRLHELDAANQKNRRLASRLEEKNLHLGKLVKKITALNRLGTALSSELEMNKLIRLVVNVALKGLRAECGFLMLREEGTTTLRMSYGMGLGEEYDLTIPVEVGESISGVVAETSEPLLIADMNRQSRFRRLSRFGFLRKSVICAPLKFKDKVLGTIELTNKKGEESFNDDDLEMLTSICAQATIALDNAKLYQKIQQSYFETVRALIQAVEEKDRYTRGHSERVTIFSLKIAETLGLDVKRLEVIKYAGYLHDIGKIGIDINILQKKGKLSAEEFSLVKNHPLIGERIIAPIEFLSHVRPCISQHHERYDGFGYPQGLCGRDMTLEARILAVADAYDAMITDRPYRRAFPKDVAVAELRRCSGTQFDPEIVQLFVEVLETDHDIRELEKSLSAVGT